MKEKELLEITRERGADVKSVSVKGITMNYISFGNGEKAFVILPALSVHSVMGAADAIEKAYRDFSEAYTVYVFDRAESVREGYTVRNMAEDTASAMRALNITDAAVFGASQGGMIAQYLAIDHPELVGSMILGSTLAKPNRIFNSVVGEWIRLAKAKNERGLLESFADHVYSAHTLKTDRQAWIASASGISDEEYRRFIILAEACGTFDCCHLLSSVRCPVLVIGSEGDRVATAEGSRQIAAAIGCGIYLYDETYGHGVYDEAPDYRQRCMNFLTDISEDK